MKKGRAKRSFKGRRRSRTPRSNIVADSTYSEKLTYEAELIVNAAATQANFCFHWARSGISTTTELFPVGSNTGNSQYSQCAGMFKSYKITSAKVEYKPYYFSAGNAATIAMKSINSGTTMDVVGAFVAPAALNTFRAALDAKEYDPQRPFKRFYRISKWAN